MDPELRETLGRYFELIQLEFDRGHGQLNSVHDQLQAQITSLQTQVTSLQTQVTSLQTQVTSLQTQVTTLQSQVAVVQDDQVSIRAELNSLRLEMTERFISSDEQIRTLTLRMEQFEANTRRDLVSLKDGTSRLDQRIFHLDERIFQLDERMKAGFSQQDERMKSVETGIVGVHARIDSLGDDMRQRFRGVTERLGQIEKRYAA